MTAHLTFEGLYTQAGDDLIEHTTAVFDTDPDKGPATYRYVYSCRWSTTVPPLLWIGRNPSTATARDTDHTVTKIKGFTRRCGYGGFDLLNLCALRSADPGLLLTHPAPIGPRNDEILAAYARHVTPVIVVWGSLPGGREQEVLGLLRAAGATVLCLGTTRDGRPCHPARMPYSTQFVPFRTSGGA